MAQLLGQIYDYWQDEHRVIWAASADQNWNGRCWLTSGSAESESSRYEGLVLGLRDYRSEMSSGLLSRIISTWIVLRFTTTQLDLSLSLSMCMCYILYNHLIFLLLPMIMNTQNSGVECKRLLCSKTLKHEWVPNYPPHINTMVTDSWLSYKFSKLYQYSIHILLWKFLTIVCVEGNLTIVYV